MSTELLTIGILLAISIVLAFQMFTFYIKIRMSEEQRPFYSYVKEYIFKITALVLALLCLISIIK